MYAVNLVLLPLSMSVIGFITLPIRFDWFWKRSRENGAGGKLVGACYSRRPRALPLLYTLHWNISKEQKKRCPQVENGQINTPLPWGKAKYFLLFNSDELLKLRAPWAWFCFQMKATGVLRLTTIREGARYYRDRADYAPISMVCTRGTKQRAFPILGQPVTRPDPGSTEWWLW